MAKQIKKEPAQDIVEEIVEEIEEIIEEPPKKKSAPMVTPKFENKLDLSPVVDAISGLSQKLDMVLKPKEEPKKDDPAPAPTETPKKREYRLFDEFDPSIEA